MTREVGKLDVSLWHIRRTNFPMTKIRIGKLGSWAKSNFPGESNLPEG